MLVGICRVAGAGISHTALASRQLWKLECYWTSSLFANSFKFRSKQITLRTTVHFQSIIQKFTNTKVYDWKINIIPMVCHHLYCCLNPSPFWFWFCILQTNIDTGDELWNKPLISIMWINVCFKMQVPNYYFSWHDHSVIGSEDIKGWPLIESGSCAPRCAPRCVSKFPSDVLKWLAASVFSPSILFLLRIKSPLNL